MNALDQFKAYYKSGNLVLKLIIINTAIFVAVNLIDTGFYLFKSSFTIIPWLAVPASFSELIYKPWTIVSYMFLHQDFLHILFNMMWLYIFGEIFLKFLKPNQLLGVYILGGISGAVLYILAFNFIPVFTEMASVSVALGASASILAITMAISTLVPNYEINLLIIGKVQLKYVALVSIFIDLLSLRSGNAGGHIAHLGGAIFGFIFILQHKSGTDITKGIGNLLSAIAGIFQPKQRFTIKEKNTRKMQDTEYNLYKKQHQASLDGILEKIKKSGYESLSKEEKELLFKESRKS